MATERDRVIGARVHALIAAHLRNGGPPTPRQVWVSTARMFAAEPMTQNHAARQRAACAVGAYFALFWPQAWGFVGAEVSLGTGRVDLVWETHSGRVVIDEVKMAGHADMVDDAATVAQVRRYCDAATVEFGDRFAGVRLLPLAAPARALWCAPGAQRVRLADVEEAA
jgi:hypothetical protein